MVGINAKNMVKITENIFKGYLQCKYKALLKISVEIGIKSDYENMLFERGLEFKVKAIAKCFRITYRVGMTTVILNKHEILSSGWRKAFVNAEVDDGTMCSHCDVLERVYRKSNLGSFYYTPVLLIENENFSREDKIFLGFNGLAIGNFQGRMPDYGKIIYGHRFLCTKVRIDKYIQYARKIITELKGYIDKENQPKLTLNSYCRECEFANLCKARATEKDDLSLLGGMTEKEIGKQNQRGIFTVTQYSYAFRPRKRRKLPQSNSAPRMLELKALAVRTGKVYVYDKPILNISNLQIYIDVEGDPNRGFNYLIGMLIIQNGIETRESFWANDFTEEGIIFTQFFKKLEKYNEFSLFHYGSYETKFFKKMKNRIEERHVDLYEKIIKNSTNILSLIYSNIYSPTYSNDLKDIGNYLGVKWTEEDASGIQSMVWRRQWEKTKSDELKSKLVQYDEEYKDMSSKFSILLREIIATVDKDGLKKRYLNKHNISVEGYFDYILNNTYKSGLALKYQKRFEKTKGKLFTFMNYNGVPWNNNNAEHAIKHFADYRNTVAGQIREFGLRNYLMLLSAYQTCEYKGISFLKFLLSKETDIDKFRLLKNKVKIQDDFDPHYSSDIGKYDRSDRAFFV